MAQLKINQAAVNADNAKELTKLCPFGAISYDGEKLDISSGCKMCRLCVRKGPAGVIEEVTEEIRESVDKTLWNGICVFCDCSDGEIHRVTFELIGKARELAAVIKHPVYALVIGNGIDAHVDTLLHYGVDKVYVYDDAAFSDFRIEPYTAAFCDFIDKVKPSSVLVGATNLGRQLAPRVAARVRAGLTADCTVLEMKENTDLVQIRPAFGGNIMAQIISPDRRPQFCTVRYKVFTEPKPSESVSGMAIRMRVTDKMRESAIEIIEKNAKPKDIDISEADVIVAVGRGAKSEQTLALANELCECLGGVMACTRPLAEENVMNPKRQIGLSGRTVKPKFIICLGISGAVQFAAGMKSSDCILAVNTDPKASIFDVAHYGIVGDVNEILPILLEKIKEGRADV